MYQGFPVVGKLDIAGVFERKLEDLIAQGADPEVRQLYREYEDLVYKLKKAAKIDKHTLGQSSLITSLVKLLDDIAQRGNSGKLHD